MSSFEERVENTNLKNCLRCSKSKWSTTSYVKGNKKETKLHTTCYATSVNTFPHILIHYLVLIIQFPKKIQ